MRAMLTLLVMLVACDGPPLVEAQTSGGGIVKIFTDGTSVCGSGTSADRIRYCGSVNDGVFGDGHDGACVFDGVTNTFGFTILAVHSVALDPSDPLYGYTLYLQNRDLFCTTMTISNNVLLSPQGYRDYASISIVMSGNARITSAGTRGFDGVNGGGPGGAGSTGVFPTAASGGGAGNSGAGSNVAGNGAANRPRGWPSTSVANAGNGGAGNAAAGLGGTLGSVIGASLGDVHTLQGVTSARTATTFTIGNVFVSGGGGGGDNAGHKGGGGGGGGTWVAVSSPSITTGGTSQIDAVGGTGGDGDVTGKTGGGGGGTAGIVGIAYNGATPRTSVAGGAGGLGHNGGANGSAGNDGLLMLFKMGVQ